LLTGDVDRLDVRPIASSYMLVLEDKGEAGLSGGDPDMKAIRLNNSVALRLDCELARAFRLALEVVIEGSVADALSSLGLLWLLLLRVEESLRCMRRESGVKEAIFAYAF